MPDNALFYYDLPPLNVQDEKLRDAEEPLREIVEAVKAKKCRDTIRGHFEKVKLGVYHRMTKTKSFYATDKCISCGLCAERCPDQAIEMQNGKPVWVKETCLHCAACISRCPAQAIEHGKGTVGRTRYVNPIFR
jgi:MinD superfamily P-loop ATPase